MFLWVRKTWLERLFSCFEGIFASIEGKIVYFSSFIVLESDYIYWYCFHWLLEVWYRFRKIVRHIFLLFQHLLLSYFQAVVIGSPMANQLKGIAIPHRRYAFILFSSIILCFDITCESSTFTSHHSPFSNFFRNFS